MSQNILRFEIPKKVLTARRKLVVNESKEKNLLKKVSDYEVKLNDTRGELEKARVASLDVAKELVLVSCLELEKLLSKQGKGWCPLCGVVPFEQICLGYIVQSNYFTERWRGREYHTYLEEAHTEYTYQFYRLPHTCIQVDEMELEDPLRYQDTKTLMYHTVLDEGGGTIASAPDEIFGCFGIPKPSSESLERVKFSIWDLFRI